MTSNQIAYAQLKEQMRANAAKEAISWEENRLKRVQNDLTAQRQLEEARHNVASENINAVSAHGSYLKGAGAYSQAQTASKKQAEEVRHNMYDESMYGLKYGNDMTKTFSYMTGATNLPRTGKALAEAVYNIYTMYKSNKQSGHKSVEYRRNQLGNA